jgi:hypothetical protein
MRQCRLASDIFPAFGGAGGRACRTGKEWQKWTTQTGALRATGD